MKKYMIKNKKTSFCIALALLASSLFAQEANDGFVVPLNEDFTNSAAAAPAPVANAGGESGGLSIKQGAWIEVTSSNKAIIRDIGTGKKKGYEFDNSHFLSNFNWWFWGDISPKFHLDAEIAVWDFDKTLYQANSYADNVPDVTWGDGLQTLVSMPFSWLHNANDDGIGAFNKMGFTIVSPFVEVKLGYGDLKANGMLDFDGIYHVIDRWDYVGKGFTEVSLGKDIRQFGDVTVNATVALSMMRGTYGMYDLLDITYGDEKNPLVEGALTFGSYTTEDELFRYNEQNINAASAYFAVSPIDPLKLELHGIGTFGTDVDLDSDAIAVAGRVGWKADKWNVRVMESYAAKNVNSVWGSDGTDYDDINTNTSTTQFDFAISPADSFSFGLDETASYVLNSSDPASKHSEYKGYTSFRTEPYFDIDLSGIVNKGLTVGLYGVVNIDKLASDDTDDGTKVNFKEAGIELGFADVVPKIQKLTFDYALKANAEWEMDGSKIATKSTAYDLGEIMHSLMLVADVNENLALTAAGIYRQYIAKTQITEQPLGFALGFEIKKTVLPGHPKFWMHFTYGMDPYEDDNYALFRADDKTNKPAHRTYLLNTLDDYAGGTNVASFIRAGLIWDL